MNVNDLVVMSPAYAYTDQSCCFEVLRVLDMTKAKVLLARKTGKVFLVMRHEYDFEPATARMIEVFWPEAIK